MSNPFENNERYKLERLIGEGRTSQVFLALDRTLNQPVAIKVLRDGLSQNARARFLREVRILRTVQHPAIVRGFDVLEQGDSIAAVLEYIPGLPLNEFLKKRPSERSSAAALLAQIADGVAQMHAVEIVHRDIKPGNIIVRADKRPVLVDFGAAWETTGTSRLTSTGTTALGTPEYMSPEQINRWQVGAPSARATLSKRLCSRRGVQPPLNISTKPS